MRILIATLTALMLFVATPVVAGDYEKGQNAYYAGDYQKAFRLFMPLAATGNGYAQNFLGVMYSEGQGVTKNVPGALPAAVLWKLLR